MEKIYYKHMIVRSGDQDDVETEINSYIEDANKLGETKIISLNVIPERVQTVNIDGYGFPKYWYHISLVYTNV